MEKILKAYKIELAPNNVQVTKLKQNVGSARWAYNWGLAQKIETYAKNEKSPNAIFLHRELNKLKKTEVPWMYESSKCSPQEALRDLDKAFSNFFTRCKKGSKAKGFPKFKSKHSDKQSFRLTGTIKVSNRHIQLPNLGKIKLKESGYIPSNVKIFSATVSLHASKWFVSIQVEEYSTETPNPINAVIGVDLGIKTLATCSDGTVYENPKALRKNLKKLKHQQRKLSRKTKKSKNYGKQKKKLAKLHYKISSIRKDCLHKVTTKIINENQVIVIEDLAVSNMMKNHKLSQAISDVGFYEFRRQLIYKAKWSNRTIIVANRFFPSSKMDWKSKIVNSNLKLSDRVIYHEDGTTTDRDLNAAINLKNYYTESSSGINASGDEKFILEKSKRCSSVNEEFNLKPKVYLLKK